MQQSDIPHPVSPEELQQAVAILAKFQPGYLPFPLFMAIARLVVFAIIEIVPLRRATDGTVEVLLTQRPTHKDELWPGMWHNPGVVVLASDTPGSFSDAFERVLRHELGMTGSLPTPVFVGLSLVDTRRGSDAKMIHYVELPTNFQSATGTFFALDALPEDVIDSNEPVIRQAAAAYKNAQ